MREYLNIQFKSFINAKPQPDKIIFNPKLCYKLPNNYNELKYIEGKNIFFTCPDWITEQKGLKSIYIYGKVTQVRPKSIQINFTEFFPISQISDIYVYVGSKKQQFLLKDFKEFERK